MALCPPRAGRFGPRRGWRFALPRPGWFGPRRGWRSSSPAPGSSARAGDGCCPQYALSSARGGVRPLPQGTPGRGTGHEKLCNSAFSVLRVFLRPAPPSSAASPAAAPPLLPSWLRFPSPQRRPRRSRLLPSPASSSPLPSSAPLLLPARSLLSLLGGLDRPKKLLPKIQPLPLGLPGPRCDLHASSSFCPPHPLDIFTGVSNNDCNSWNVKSTITEPRNLCPVLYTDFHNFQGTLLRHSVISAKSTKRRAWGCRNYTKRSRLCAASMGPT